VQVAQAPRDQAVLPVSLEPLERVVVKDSLGQQGRLELLDRKARRVLQGQLVHQERQEPREA